MHQTSYACKVLSHQALPGRVAAVLKHSSMGAAVLI